MSDPRKSKFREFLASITVGESRDITQATTGSIHFPAIHYFALFIGRCINGKDEACHMCVPDLSVLRSAVLGDRQYNLGAIVARRLHHNGLHGDLFGGIYATRIARYLGVSVHTNDEPLPPAYLDYHAMASHRFIEWDNQTLKYRLIFNRQHAIPIVLPAPTLFNFQENGRYTITMEEANAYYNMTEAIRVRAAAQHAVADAS